MHNLVDPWWHIAGLNFWHKLTIRLVAVGVVRGRKLVIELWKEDYVPPTITFKLRRAECDIMVVATAPVASVGVKS